MKIKFKTSNIYNENVLTAASAEAEALFELMNPRQTLKPAELAWVGKMGFEIEIIGDKRELTKEMKRSENAHLVENPEYGPGKRFLSREDEIIYYRKKYPD